MLLVLFSQYSEPMLLNGVLLHPIVPGQNQVINISSEAEDKISASFQLTSLDVV